MSHDIITVGGGLGGSVLAIAMARRGHDVLVLESEPELRDRVRGEQLATWGTDEARQLGILDVLGQAPLMKNRFGTYTLRATSSSTATWPKPHHSSCLTSRSSTQRCKKRSSKKRRQPVRK